MIRRLHTPRLLVGDNLLDPSQARHARDVLRLEEGTTVEIFDDAGTTATGTLVFPGPNRTAVRVDRIDDSPPETGLRLVIASAVPKGERADWMIEKLSELGVFAFIPLDAERSVVKPEGKNKHERWVRIATESAKQSRRAGVMRLDKLSSVQSVLDRYPRDEHRTLLCLSTRPDAEPFSHVISRTGIGQEWVLLIGPEGGWSNAEIETFDRAGVRGVKLTPTVLRVETAAIVGASTVMVMLANG